jgi:hypothetical protein
MSTDDDTQPPQVQPPRKRHRVFLWALTDVITGAIYGICQLPRRPR